MACFLSRLSHTIMLIDWSMMVVMITVSLRKAYIMTGRAFPNAGKEMVSDINLLFARGREHGPAGEATYDECAHA